MTHEEARDACARLQREHPDRTTHTWLPRETAGGDWEVARVAKPFPGRGPAVATTESKPKPPQPDDPRPAQWRDVGGPYGGG